MLKELVTESPNPILVVDAHARVLLANEAAGVLFGRRTADMVGLPFAVPAHQETLTLGSKSLRIVAHLTHYEHRVIRILWFVESLDFIQTRLEEAEVRARLAEQEVSRAQREAHKQSMRANAAFEKLKEVELKAQQLQSDFHTAALDPGTREKVFEDPLTGLPNAMILERFLHMAACEAVDTQSSLAVLIIDIDRFQGINDLLGEDAGDDLICKVAERFRPLTQDTDILVRRGADEFVAVLTASASGRRSAEQVAQDRAEEFSWRVFNSLDRAVLVGGQPVHVTVSIGAVVFQEGLSVDELLSRALSALYAAKERGRNDLFFFTPQLQSEIESRRSLIGQLREAVDRQEFELHYQPIIDLKTGELAGAEALLRWRHPARGLLAPNAFLDAAEKSNLIAPIGAWVIKQACLQAAAYPELFVSVNLSPQQLLHSQFVDTFVVALERAQAKPENLVVELPEGVGTTRNDRVREVLTDLASRGVQLGIDDFGSGSSSLKDLLDLSLRFLKVDRVFVDRLPGDDQAVHITESIVALARSLRTACLAEGIETLAQVRSLAKLGCGLAQGHYFSPAVTSQKFLGLRGKRWPV